MFHASGHAWHGHRPPGDAKYHYHQGGQNTKSKCTKRASLTTSCNLQMTEQAMIGINFAISGEYALGVVSKKIP